MEGLPTYISFIFIACAIATYGFAYYAPRLAAPQRRTANYVAAILGVWLLLTALLAHDGFFLDFDFRPPRLMIFVFIIFLGGISLFFLEFELKKIAKQVLYIVYLILFIELASFFTIKVLLNSNNKLKRDINYFLFTIFYN